MTPQRRRVLSNGYRILTIAALIGARVLLRAKPACDLNGRHVGLQRVVSARLTYAVMLTAACTNGGCAIILDLHGATMRASSQEVETRLRALGTGAVERGAPTPFVVVQPTAGGSPPMWKTEDADRVFAF